MSAFHGKLLLIDNNEDFLNEVQRDGDLLQSHPLMIQTSLALGLKIFEKHKNFIRILVASSKVFKTQDEVQHFQAKMGNHPYLFITHRGHHPLESLFNSDKTLIEPKSYRDIIEAVTDLISKRPDWKSFEFSHDKKFVEIKLKDEDYIGIGINDFMLLPQSPFNVFIKIGPGNFIKVFNAGDKSEEEVIDRYRQKGIGQVFLPTQEHKKYITLCEKLSWKKVRSESAPKEKLKTVFRLGNEVARNMASLGLGQENLDFAETFLDQSVTMIKNLSLRDGNLKNFIEDLQDNEHIAAVSFLSGILANELGFESLKSIKLVGMAALLHDVGLYALDPNADEKTLAPDSEIMQKHSLHGADILRKSGKFEDVVCQAVEQHHMRRRGGDSSERSGNLNLVTEIISVADALHNSILSETFDPKKLDEFLMIDLKRFSHPIEKALLKILDKKRKGV